MSTGRPQYINVSRWQNKIRAITGIDGDNPVPTIHELVPVIVVESDRDEWGYAGNERPGGNFFQQPAVAGEFGEIGIVNPPDSGVLAVIRLVENMSAALLNLKIGRLTEYAPNGPVDIAFLSNETREWSLTAAAAATLAPRLACFVRRGSLAALLPAANGWFTTHQLYGAAGNEPASFGAHKGRAIMLAPGMVCAVEGTVANSVFQVNIAIRERPIESSKGS